MSALGAIRTVTFTVPALAPVERAYVDYLGYRVHARGNVDASTAAAWGAPATAGCRIIDMVPEIGEETCLRFIEDPDAGSVAPLTTHGWAAAELTVRNTDTLAARLANSPFTIIGAPANLKGFEWIRAMQVFGPAGECLYLTDVSADAHLAHARCDVGHVFIVVAGGGNVADMATFYRGFGNDVTDPVRVPIGVLNRANALPAETRHGLALVTLPDGTRIELDEYPAACGRRVVRPGHLPPGMSIVSFAMADRPAICLEGGAGELIELNT